MAGPIREQKADQDPSAPLTPPARDAHQMQVPKIIIRNKTIIWIGLRVIYVGRNPKDVAVSYYHHHRLTR